MFRHLGVQRYLQSATLLGIGRGIQLFTGLISSILVARYLGPEQYGMLSYAQSYVIIFAAFASAGIESIVVRDLTQAKEDRNVILGTSFLIKLLGSILLVVVAGVSGYFYGAGKEIFVIILIISTSYIFQSLKVIDLAYQSDVKAYVPVYAEIIQSVISIIIKIILIFAAAKLVSFAILIVFDTFIISLLLIYKFHKDGNNILNFNFNSGYLKLLLKSGAPLMLVGLLGHVQAYIDQIMIGNMIGMQEVAIYSVAIKVMAIVSIAPVIICTTVAPAIANAKLKDITLYNSRILNLYRVMFLVFILISIPLYLLSDIAIYILFGESYVESGVLLSLMVIRLLFTCFGSVKSLYLVNENLFFYSLIIAVVGAVSNVAFNFLLIHLYGSVGAIWGTIFSYSISVFFVDIFYKRAWHNFSQMLYSIVTFYKLELSNVLSQKNL